MTIDEQALDLGFQEYDRATTNGDDELAAFRKGVEAYEAAKWRPIEEATADDPGCGVSYRSYMLNNNEIVGEGYFNHYTNFWCWMNGEGCDPQPTHFCTIEPPPQK